CFFFSSRRRHTRFSRDWSSDVCSSDLYPQFTGIVREVNTDRASGRVVLTCLDNAERMRTPVLIPPYAAYQDYLVDGYKRSGLVRSEERRVGKECRSRWSPARERDKRER